mmetsp:Transcript_2701/g.6077  ORF Transcript_2701/g.6077 Transcript_2701/m.6077 type:complete len:341 (+) Transcript_2701:62-1084(+)
MPASGRAMKSVDPCVAGAQRDILLVLQQAQSPVPLQILQKVLSPGSLWALERVGYSFEQMLRAAPHISVYHQGGTIFARSTVPDLTPVHQEILTCVLEHQGRVCGKPVEMATLGNRLTAQTRARLRRLGLQLTDVVRDMQTVQVVKNERGADAVEASTEELARWQHDNAAALIEPASTRRGEFLADLQAGRNNAGDELVEVLRDVASALQAAGGSLKLTCVGNQVSARTRRFLSAFKVRVSGIVKCFPECFSIVTTTGTPMLHLSTPLGLRQFDAPNFRMPAPVDEKAATSSTEGSTEGSDLGPDDESDSGSDGNMRMPPPGLEELPIRPPPGLEMMAAW